jgi:hypothetical protein
VNPPKNELEHIHYFCGNTEIADDLKVHEPQRVALYKSTAALVRAYANIADDMTRVGYTDSKVAQIKRDIDRHLKLREIIRQASGETIDLKAYEGDMRHLIDPMVISSIILDNLACVGSSCDLKSNPLVGASLPAHFLSARGLWPRRQPTNCSS